jgi:hypothetical protein
MDTTDNVKSAEKRQSERNKVNDVLLDVMDDNTGQTIGRLVDISMEGIMLISSSPIPVGSIYQVTIHLPTKVDGSVQISFGVETLWSNKSNDGNKHWTGCHILDISEQEADKVRKFIECL